MFCKQRVALKAAGTGTGALQNSGRPQSCPSPAHAQKDKEGPKGKAGSVIPTHTHTFYPIQHLLLQPNSRARHSTRNSWTELTARAKCNGFAALTGIFLCKAPPTPQKVSHALHILYSAELGVLSRFLFIRRFRKILLETPFTYFSSIL